MCATTWNFENDLLNERDTEDHKLLHAMSRMGKFRETKGR